MRWSGSATGLAAAGLLVVAGVLAGCGTSSGVGVDLAGHGHPAGSGQARARVFARAILTRQAVPPGARLSRRRPPAELLPGSRLGNKKTSVDLVKVYRVRGTGAAVLRFISAHLPADAANISRGTSTSGSAPAEQLLNYFVTGTPDGVTSAMLVATVVPAQLGSTWLRLDAQVIWAPLRTAAEHVNPASYRSVEVIAHRTLPNSGIVTKTFTEPSVVAELAGRLNAMHTAGNTVFYNCQIATSVGERLVFEPRSGQGKQLIATLTPCDLVQMRIGGKTQPTLLDRGDLPALIGRLVQRWVNRPGHREPPAA